MALSHMVPAAKAGYMQNQQVLEESKTRYSTRLAQVMSETLELTFGD